MELFTRPVVVASLQVLELQGDVDLATLPELHQATSRFVEAHPGALVAIVLDGVGSLADAGLGVLLGAAARARARHGDVVLVCAGRRLRDRLAMSRLDRALDVFASATEAARAGAVTSTEPPGDATP